jgi:hypothetical protein
MSFASRKLALSITSWFRVPEQGMKEFEVLSRASAFLVKSRFNGQGPGAKFRFPLGKQRSEDDGLYAETNEVVSQLRNNNSKDLEIPTFLPKFHVVTASHVVSPWLWPKYYPEQWLQYVDARHTHYTVELRDEQGVFITQSECIPITYHHPHRDLAVLHLDDEDENVNTLQELGYSIPELLLPPTDIVTNANTEDTGAGGDIVGDLYSYIRSDGHGGKLQFVGHKVTDGKNDNLGWLSSGSGHPATNNGDLRKPIPQRTFGQLHGRTNSQVFCRTSIELTDGMCGGPVLWDSSTVINKKAATSDSNENENNGSGSESASDSECEGIVGMTEGIVPLNYEDNKSMRGLAVFVESTLINKFVEDIEQGPIVSGVEPLIGGESVEHMAITQHTKEFVMPDY